VTVTPSFSLKCENLAAVKCFGHACWQASAVLLCSFGIACELMEPMEADKRVPRREAEILVDAAADEDEVEARPSPVAPGASSSLASESALAAVADEGAAPPAPDEDSFAWEVRLCGGVRWAARPLSNDFCFFSSRSPHSRRLPPRTLTRWWP
jgi:hypothetical protein